METVTLILILILTVISLYEDIKLSFSFSSIKPTG